MATPDTTVRAGVHLDAADAPELVRAPAATFVSVTGSGRPGTDAFYRKKRLVSDVARALPGDHDPTVVELLYWFPETAEPVGISDFYWVNPIDDLQYRVLVRIPDDTSTDAIAAARRATTSTADAGEEMEVFSLPERTVVQLMHHGRFADEARTLGDLGAFASERGLRRSGPHHEIHLDDFGPHTPQETLRTILRDPVSAG
jgi:hypothetical protein